MTNEINERNRTEYDFGEGWKATIEKTYSGAWNTKVMTPTYVHTTKHTTKTGAMLEILSYFKCS